jgi:hypothetical protein
VAGICGFAGTGNLNRSVPQATWSRRKNGRFHSSNCPFTNIYQFTTIRFQIRNMTLFKHRPKSEDETSTSRRDTKQQKHLTNAATRLASPPPYMALIRAISSSGAVPTLMPITTHGNCARNRELHFAALPCLPRNRNCHLLSSLFIGCNVTNLHVAVLIPLENGVTWVDGTGNSFPSTVCSITSANRHTRHVCTTEFSTSSTRKAAVLCAAQQNVKVIPCPSVSRHTQQQTRFFDLTQCMHLSQTPA